MRSRMIACSLGMAAVAGFSRLPEVPYWVLLLLLPSMLLAVVKSRLLYGTGAAICLGLCWGLFWSQQRMEAILPGYLEGVDFWVKGTVTGLPQTVARGQQFAFEVEQSCFDLMLDDCPLESKVFSNRLILLNYYGASEVSTGDRWWWRVRLNKPHGFANAGGFDYEGWLIRQGYSAKGYVRENSFNRQLEPGWTPLSTLRFQLRERLQLAMQGFDHYGTILALVLGDREQISQESWALFTATGTNHLIVISGLHVGFIALICYWIANRFIRYWPFLLLYFPAQKFASAIAIASAFGYALLAGFSLPTQRAFIMVMVFMGSRLCGWQAPHSLSYCLALTLVLALNPMSVSGAGFWLSFGAVGTLLLAYGGVKKVRCGAAQTLSYRGPVQFLHGLWYRWIHPQWVVFIGMSVPLAVWMQQISLLSPLANMLAIPLVSLLIVPLCLGGALLLHIHHDSGTWLLRVADSLLGKMTLILAKLPELAAFQSIWHFLGLSIGAALLALAGTLLLLMPRGWPGKWLAPMLFLPLLFPGVERIPQAAAEITVLDVGQGLAVVVQTANRVLVYDTGPRFSDTFDAGSGVIYPFLRSRGIRHIDHLVVSHLDNDHVGGLEALMSLVPVDRLLMSFPRGSQLVPQQALPCILGESWRWDAVDFEFLFPPQGSNYAGNDSSCVLQIRAGGQSILIPGDIEARSERQLVDIPHASLLSDVLIAPHHGSNTSSTAAFVQAVSPQHVIYSAGYRSQYGHPAANVMATYALQGVKTWNTALSGAISLRLGQAPVLEPRQYRLLARRYWYTCPDESSQLLHGVVMQEC
jgi:competence protein ComEC